MRIIKIEYYDYCDSLIESMCMEVIVACVKLIIVVYLMRLSVAQTK
jgi:hypothetical protein